MLSITLSAGEFLAAWSFLAMTVVTPGPNVLNTIALAIGSGQRVALGAALGTALAITLCCLSMMLGVSALLAAAPVARTVLTLTAISPVARDQPGDLALLCLGACAVAGAIHGLDARAFSSPPAARGFLRAAPVINLGVGLFFGGFALTLALSLLPPV